MARKPVAVVESERPDKQHTTPKPGEGEMNGEGAERPKPGPAVLQERVAAAFAPELTELNAKHAVLLCEGGRCVVMSCTRDVIGNGEARERIKFQSFTDFRNRYSNRCIKVDDRVVRLGTWWLNHPDRRQYTGLTFEPGGPKEIDSHLNLWTGFGVEAKKGAWPLMRAHIREVLARDAPDNEDYIIKWLAWAVQNPGQAAETALVLKGDKGTGKGVLGRVMKQFFGQHGLHISGASQLTGRFNSHLRDCCLLFADEAISRGDAEGEAKLQTLITEPSLVIEAKGRDAVEARNCLHIIMASNRDWVIPASAGERRYAVFNVASTHAGDPTQGRKYFEALYAEQRAGGDAAMLYDLLNVDLGAWHPRYAIPQTEALRQQKEESLGPKETWLLSLLEDGDLPGASPSAPRHAVAAKLYKVARETTPALKHESDKMLGGFLSNWGVMRGRHKQQRARIFPDLATMRAKWEKRFGAWTWEEARDDWGTD